ncbi:hypothetical protein GCM10010124_35150 [Pilimelia terevasa]|uniref:Potassium channel domain-containing protein n=1 Tax=Pilimelia terevasa TaxID=53372 RepID=A0A8J3BT67_9ACTN|nr:potassium channel family protein [Pilimelia terevasa]GGK39400.1 hypothetical protein GCM10010124_35150 [Pilimelia terevasa]
MWGILRPVHLVYRGLVWIANAPGTLLVFYLVVLAVSATAYSLLEDKNLGDALWWSVVTASTVGYGDTYPTTIGGRILAGILISGMVLLVIPLITAHFASKLIVDADAFRHEEQEEIKQRLREIQRLAEGLAAASSPGDAGRRGE